MPPANAVPFSFREDYDSYSVHDASNPGHVDLFRGLVPFRVPVPVRAHDHALVPSRVRVHVHVRAPVRGLDCGIDFSFSFASWHPKDREEFDF